MYVHIKPIGEKQNLKFSCTICKLSSVKFHTPVLNKHFQRRQKTKARKIKTKLRPQKTPIMFAANKKNYNS